MKKFEIHYLEGEDKVTISLVDEKEERVLDLNDEEQCNIYKKILFSDDSIYTGEYIDIFLYFLSSIDGVSNKDFFTFFSFFGVFLLITDLLNVSLSAFSAKFILFNFSKEFWNLPKVSRLKTTMNSNASSTRSTRTASSAPSTTSGRATRR